MFKCLFLFAARVTRKTWPAQMWAEIRITLDLKYLGVICKTSCLINLFVKNLKTKGLGTSLLLFQEIRLVVISAPHEETYRKHCPLSQPWAWIASNVVSVMRPRRVRWLPEIYAKRYVNSFQANWVETGTLRIAGAFRLSTDASGSGWRVLHNECSTQNLSTPAALLNSKILIVSFNTL